MNDTQATKERICPQCGTRNDQYAMACGQCNTLLFDPKSSTTMMRIDPALLRLRRVSETPDPVQLEHKLQLSIRGMVERVSFEEGTELVLGRTELNWTEPDRFDLTRYGAHERGVSRAHAVLRFKDGQLTITDLGSANGTSLNGKRLPPNEAHIVKDNDEIMLARLAVRVRFTPHGDTGKLLLNRTEAETADLNPTRINAPAPAESPRTRETSPVSPPPTMEATLDSDDPAVDAGTVS
ncbi:MAG: FHA domain-containing protein [Anaerolineae bacterium]|nr:FHA domain-containing protein [Anaerolineae bacterium]